MAWRAAAPQTDLLGHLEVASAKPNADDTTIGRTVRFVERLQTCWIQDSTLFGWIETNETVTLRFDVYHCDDDERCRDDTE